MNNDDLIEKIEVLKAQRDLLTEYIYRSVEKMVAARIDSLKAEGVPIHDPQISELLRNTLDSFKHQKIAELVDMETHDIEEQIRQYSEQLTKLR